AGYAGAERAHTPGVGLAFAAGALFRTAGRFEPAAASGPMNERVAEPVFVREGASREVWRLGGSPRPHELHRHPVGFEPEPKLVQLVSARLPERDIAREADAVVFVLRQAAEIEGHHVPGLHRPRRRRRA